MSDTSSITLVKRFTYRDSAEEFSNTYHFTGDTPGNEAEWKALGEAIWESEATCFATPVSLATVYGYEAGNETSVAQIHYDAVAADPANGTLSGADGTRMAGDQAGTFRARGYIGANGKRVYCTKYFHGQYVLTSDPDELTPATRAANLAHAQKMLSGDLPGDAVWCCPQAQGLDQPLAARYVTTRTLKRRGKRP